MASLRAPAAASRRALWTALLAFCLALRLITPAGFMPAFEHGGVTIIICPDQDGGTPVSPMHHHHGGAKKLQPQCPYAAGSWLGAVAGDFGSLLDVLVFAAALLLGRTFLFLERNNARERPPTRAPPFPA